MNIDKEMLKYENLLSKYACYDKDALRIYPFIRDIRPNYSRDTDRIIHTHSFTKYIGKTQVFSMNNNDHISTRIIHVQLVNKIARTIGRALSLNEDLIEAIALGHDIGHAPFGHVGESILNKISIKNNEGFFSHNVQSVRNLMVLEDNGKGKNLTVQVLDGILCHNGENEECIYTYKNKNIDEFLNDYNLCYQNIGYAKNLTPMTLEGCVVKISDIIAYLGRDIEDATTLKMINPNNLPIKIKNNLGCSNSEIINNIILDIIKNSYNKPYIKMSAKIYSSIKNLIKYNYKNIYYKANSNEEKEKFEEMFNKLFEYYLNALTQENKNNSIYFEFLNHMNQEYITTTTPARKVIDYIAGMTDNYFIAEYKGLN